MKKSNFFFLLSRYKEMYDCANKAKEISKRINDNYGLANSLNNIASNYMTREKLDEALEKFKKAVDIFVEIDNQREKFFPIKNLGRLYRLKNNTKKALTYFHQALEIITHLNDKVNKVIILHELGEIYIEQKNENGIKHIEETITIYNQIGNKKALAECYELLGNYYKNMNKELSKQYFEKALEKSKDQN